MSYECVPILSLIRIFGLQWLASLCIACWWSQQHSMVHRQQIKSPLPWNPCCKCNPCSQLARKVPGTCSVGRCTFLTLLVPLHFAFDYGFLQTRQFESRKGMKRRISVNQNELALPDQSVSTKSAWPSLRFSLIQYKYTSQDSVCVQIHVHRFGYQRGFDLFGLEPLHWRCMWNLVGTSWHVNCNSRWGPVLQSPGFAQQPDTLIDPDRFAWSLWSFVSWLVAHLENCMILKDLESSYARLRRWTDYNTDLSLKCFKMC